MKHYKNKKSLFKIYFLIISVILTFIISITLSKYVSNFQSADASRVAKVALNTEDTTTTVPINISPQNDYTPECYTFTVNNTSEVSLQYKIRIQATNVETTSNLPIAFLLYKNSNTNALNLDTVIDESTYYRTHDFQQMSASSSSQTDTYYLKMQWTAEAGDNSYEYSKLIDMVTITVEWEQVH